MGYEVKIYAGYLGRVEGADTAYMHVVGMVDLSKCGNLSPSKDGTPIYFYYEGDGSTAITEDCYGDTLRAIPVTEMLENIKKASKHCPDYRRWKPAIALLESLQEFEGDEIYCTIYGH